MKGGGRTKKDMNRIVETESEESSTDKQETNRTTIGRKWNDGVPIGGILVQNRLNTDTPPGPPSVESIPVQKPNAGKLEDNW